jgi:methylenetetrahydrofolate dehydrogenase (NADP+)/methenyltetrahydrofolate cyclohydrolase
MAKLLDGEALAVQVRAFVASEIDGLAKRHPDRPRPGLATLLVGDDPPSARYVAMKHRDCAEVGIASHQRTLPGDATQEEVEAIVAELDADPAVDAFLVQLPLPRHLDEQAVLEKVDPAKDADGLHPVNLGRLLMGVDGPVPATPAGIVALLSAYGVPVEGRHVVVIGRGLTIGRPLAALLAQKRPGCNAAVTVVHTGVADLTPYLERADVVVAAAGSPGLVRPEQLRPGVAVVAAGLARVGGRLVSDLAEGVDEVAGWLSPTVGGVGPMTRAMLLVNTLQAAARRRGEVPPIFVAPSEG